jgi:ubiquinone biosynthesis protein
MIRDLRNGLRVFSLARKLARHDALFVFDRIDAARLLVLALHPFVRRQPGRPGEKLARALQDSGPSFIKLGQALASRSDLLGEQIAADLSQLQDRLPPFPFDDVRTSIEDEFGRPLEELFRSFDEEPVAAASIAQVHFAVDAEGREVAVKVLRPGIEAAFDCDLDLFFWIGERVELHIPVLRRLRLVESVATLADAVEREMDLRFEAAAAELAENFAGDPSFHVPVVDWTRTGKRVLTTQRVSGIKIDEREAIIAAGHDPHRVLARATTAFFNQVFRDGFFHADLHAGNLFVRSDGGIAAVDFGIMGRLDGATRRHLGEMLLAFLGRDYRRAAEVHFEAGWVPADRSLDAFAQACRSIAEPILDKPQSEISIARLLGHLFQVTETFAMETQPQLLLLQKTMLVAEGTGRKLAPDANMWLLSRPLIESWTADTLGPQARVRQATGEIVSTVARLPELARRVERGLAAVADGYLRLHPESLRELRGRGGRSSFAGWIVAAILAVILVIILVE